MIGIHIIFHAVCEWLVINASGLGLERFIRISVNWLIFNRKILYCKEMGQFLYNTPQNTDLDITWSCCGSQIFLPLNFTKEL